MSSAQQLFSSSADLPEPIREELWGVEKLEQHAVKLAGEQRVRPGRAGDRRLVPRVKDNGRVLLESYRGLAAAIQSERTVTPGAEWLVDNFHLVEEQLREIHEDLPAGFYRELPKLVSGPLQGYPRVYAIAHHFVAHTDSLFDAEVLRRFVVAYQTVEPLTIGELWAVVISLRVVLVENLRRLAERMVRARGAREEADRLADALLGVELPAEPASPLRPFESRTLDVPFAVELLGRLRGQDPEVTPALAWLDRRLASQGTTPDEIVALEHQRQTAMNATVRNVITSMRLISASDWPAFFDGVSLVDRELAAHPGYREMDFATRDLYRHAVEDLARGSGRSEIEVARRAVQRVAEAGPDATPAERDPGFVLVAGGRRAYERELGARVPPGRWLERVFLALATPGYLGTLALVTGLLLALPLWFEGALGVPVWTLLVLGLLALIPASDLALQLINSRVMERVRPKMLPRLELKGGVPPELRTLVAVPTLLTTLPDLVEQIARLEIHYLANPQDELRFALLSDWRDAPEETVPGDRELLTAALDGVARLNVRHGTAPDGEPRFQLFHRRRVWNEGDRIWYGWERKRGKLEELNRVLRGAADTSFMTGPSVAWSVPRAIRYVLTLDADTRLPREAARRLIGTLAHPLNQPRFDKRLGRVVSGYGVLQPRVTPILPADREGSLFQRIFSGPAGIDPYAAAVSDVYQDLFGEGSFTGKGIYDVDAFRAALEGKVPESALLSHDLFEGIFARTGLVTDVELFEEFPVHYEAAAARQHRWARGDWQLLPWVFGRGPTRDGGRLRTPIPAIGRFKMIDNLRRTLLAPAAFLTLVAGWTLPAASPAVWTGFVLGTLALPACLRITAAVIPRRRRISKRSHLLGLGAELAQAVAQVGLTVAFLAQQAWTMADAIVRTLARLQGSGRGMLQWVTAAQAKVGLGLGLKAFYRRMAGGVALAALATVLVAATAALGPRAFPWIWAGPLLLLWLLAPMLARWVSLPPAAKASVPLLPEEARTLRLLARRTWSFFETFVGPEDHALPPDNFQEEPRPVVAHRTSPTNLGLYLLSVTAARSFGWLGTVDCIERLEATLATLSRLDRFRGHFLNWYETRTLQALEPRYVSTVDSGNLAGHLLALAESCRQLAVRPPSASRALSGLADAVALIHESAPAGTDRRTQTVTRRQLDEALAAVGAALSRETVSLPELAREAHVVVDVARALAGEQGKAWHEALAWAEAALECVASHARDLAAPPEDSRRRLEEIARTAEEYFAGMEMGFLFDSARNLFSIGYRVAEGELDASHYDLLASEACLTSFLAIAKGDVPVRHWFQLGRPLTPVGWGAALISWSGSMFEYLMPALVLRSPPHSLLDQTCRRVVRRQMRYAAARDIPWGISESAFNARDLELTYQYSNFGVPGLGLKRGLSEDVVVAPYATALAAMFEPHAAIRNFAVLESTGARGRHGFYEAIDYTATRLPQGARLAVVRAYMAHHQGMTLVSLANVLDPGQDGAMPARFHALPLVQATELLLQERTPRDVAVARPRAEEVEAAAPVGDFAASAARRYRSPHQSVPRSHLLGNGRYTVMLTTAGSGYSRLKDLAVTRFREDPVRDAWGSYVFFRDARTGEVWSAGYQPAGREPESYEAVFSEDRAEIVRRDGDLTSRLEVVVSPEDEAELRRVSLTNHGELTREIDLTSYLEIVLAPPAADLAHPAFSNLFVETELLPSSGALLASRRPRSQDEPRLWAAHVATVAGSGLGALQYETDRLRFLGRGQSVRTPVSVFDGGPLSNTAGAVLDPIFSLRQTVRLAPGTTARVTFTTLVGPSREGVLDRVDKYRDPAAFDRAASMAWTQAQVQLRHLGIGHDEASLFQRLANRILYSDPSLRAPAEMLQRNTRGPSALWAYGISGDLPILLVRIDEIEDLGIVRQLLKAHEYFRLKLLPVDLVILNERASSYSQELQTALETLVRASQANLHAEGPETDRSFGTTFILRADLVTAEARDVLFVAARAMLVGRNGSLADQIARRESRRVPVAKPMRPVPPPPAAAPPPQLGLELWNGLGGFAEGGREYVTLLREGLWTPAPWINVIANPGFGFQVSESGSGYTWSGNSRENQLTPWSNDPVSDPPGETFYVRDEENGRLWGPTVLPIRQANGTYVARHGQGYSRFEHTSNGIELELLQLVPPADPVKISRLAITNRDSRPRRLSVTACVDWCLGASRAATAPFIVTSLDPGTGALLARASWNTDFGGRLAFADLGGRQTSWTGDRAEFLGRNGTSARPASLERGDRLSGRVGAGLDPCGALQTVIELRPGDRTEIVFTLGQGSQEGGMEEVRTLIERYRKTRPEEILAGVTRSWDDLAATLQVKTPDRAMDLLLNRWLLYQTLSCRVWARTAFYQAGGAYGFRDQLQDVLALTVARPEIAREHILRAASRQFVEGDVQHWWHPPSGKGVRTHISDDLLWLPFVALHYLDVTGDAAVLEEEVPFLEGPPVPDGQDDAYFAPTVARETATLYEHCARALDRRLAVGRHGLPLMGTGDWNDGMNRVGRLGEGESVWLGWFLVPLLDTLARIAEGRGEEARAITWRRHAAALKTALETAGWDGEWYRRAWFDDGSPVGSSANAECRIDSIAQSWAVLSGASDPERAARAMAAVEEHLVRRDRREESGLILLFDPPFDQTPHDPGYIKGYLPGVRENGGQYTHAGVWCVLAFAALGDGDKATELFSLLNPIHHARTRAGIHRYKVEPYVMAGDVYAEPTHLGRGGWSWYTGSAGWMYRAGIEGILGIRLRGQTLSIDPAIPRAWPSYEVALRHRGAHYTITVENPHGAMRGVAQAELDGVPMPVSAGGAAEIALAVAGTHRIRVVLGPPAA